MDSEEFLGDGLYASFDGWHIGLRAPRENGDHCVYLELGNGGTLGKFLNYVDRALALHEARLSDAEKAQSRVRDAKEDFDG